MNRQLLFLLFSVFPWIFLSAQSADSINYVIKGLVIEAEKEEAVSYAVLHLLSPDSTFVAGVRADEKGVFELSSPKAGSYLLAIDHTGYESLYSVVILREGQSVTDLDTLVLHPKSQMLENLEVSAAKTQIMMKGDTLVYNADAFRTPPGSTLGTLLSRLPGVTLEDGIIKYQGKAVSKLLINGKEFFISDLFVALENLPVEIVENIKAYETLTDEDKQKRTDSGERLNILDVTIKKEYMSTWNGNTDLAGGTDNHYSTRLFMTRFTDRLSLSAFGQLNNLNDQSEASPNGGWKNNNWTAGLNTFRKMGLNVAWDNGKKEGEDGYLKLFGSTQGSHNNYNVENVTIGETFYPGSSHNYSNTLNGRKESWNTIVADGGLSWQIDSMTNVYARLHYGHRDQHQSSIERAATFNADPYRVPGVIDPLVSVFSELNDSLMRTAINRNDQRALRYSNSNEFRGNISVGRRLSSKGHRMDLWMHFYSEKQKTTHYSLADIRYYNQEAEEPQRINNQYSRVVNTDRGFNGELAYEHALSKAQRLSGGYRIYTGRSGSDNPLYQLDSLEDWRNTWHPLGTLPSADSLAMAINRNNSVYTNYDVTIQGGHLQYRLINKNNFHVNAAFYYNFQRTQMDYRRALLDTVMVKNYFFPNPYLFVKYSFKKEGYIQFSYRSFRNSPDMTQLLDVTDDSNPLIIRKGNPNLDPSWTHRITFQFQKVFGSERKTSVWMNANYQVKDTEISNTETYDETTGIRTIRPENIDGTWSYYANAGANIPLDTKQRWNLSPSVNTNYLRKFGYFTSTQDYVTFVNRQTGFSVTPRINVSYRLEGLSLSSYNSYFIGIEKNSLQPDADQTARILNTGLNAQYEFAWGMSLSSDFYLYSCRGFTDPTMNNDQWLWNASISQSFLKKKNLVVVLEARDILAQRLSQYSNSDSYSRSTVHTNSARNMSYVMCHLIFRFSVGKKAN